MARCERTQASQHEAHTHTHTHTHVIDYLVQGDIFHLLLRVLDKVEEINVAGIQEEEQLALTPWNRLNNTARCKTKKGSTEFSECVCARIHLCVNERCLKRTKKSEHWIQRHVQKIKEKKSKQKNKQIDRSHTKDNVIKNNNLSTLCGPVNECHRHV